MQTETAKSAEKPSFNAANRQRVDTLISHYPVKVAALLPVLHVAQEQFGYLSPQVMEMVAELLETTPAHVYGTANFYDMYRFETPAKHEFIVCRNISCYLHDCDGLKRKLSDKLKLDDQGRSADGRFQLIEAECLAACDKAPVLMVDGKLYEHVDADNLPQDVRGILEKK